MTTDPTSPTPELAGPRYDVPVETPGDVAQTRVRVFARTFAERRRDLLDRLAE